ncbi:MAG: hypothetical protein EOO78_32145 [Oxalobacteraceae bacterium]|nr:MAG: hypothetical protein EOO78_32145 [Oxalobacteraceae bacterium]
MAWHDGRTFFCCPCGAREERLGAAPAVLSCIGCKGGIMAQWVPPAVAAERAAQTDIAEAIGTLI